MTDVPSGTHTVVVTDGNGRVVGHGEITISQGDDTELTLTVDENGSPLVKPGPDTENIRLELVIGPDGSIVVKNAVDITPEPPDPGPQTGDDSTLLLWSMILLMSSAILFFLPLAKGQGKSE